MRHKVALAAFGTSLFFSQFASAQDPFAGGHFNIQQFTPAPAGDPFFEVSSSQVSSSTIPSIELLGDYAFHDLRLVQINPSGSTSGLGTIIQNSLYANLDISWSLFDHLLLDLDVPVALAQGGNSSNLPSTPSGGALGDMRIALRGLFFGKKKDPFSLSLQVDGWLPTGSTSQLTGDGSASINPKLLGSGRIGNFIYSGNAGFWFRKYIVETTQGEPAIGNSFTFGAAAGLLMLNDKLQIGPELYGNAVLESGTTPPGTKAPTAFGTHSTPVEAMLGGKYNLSPWVLGLGVGTGLTKAPGVAPFRALLSVAYVPSEIPPPPPDTDKDGIPDPQDACPTTPGVASPDPAKNGCPPPPPPPPDTDGDGIIDSLDACPTVPGVASSDPSKNGCPPDTDGDGIVDPQDACPTVPGVKSDDPKKNGCPPDKDGDGIPDAQDACPDVPGVKSDNPKFNGCPADMDNDGVPNEQDACPTVPGLKDPNPKKNGCPLARIENGQVKISEQIHFKTGSSQILKDSDPILEAVAKILIEHPEITMVKIEGHTDNKGKPKANLALSKSRAKAVLQSLVKLKVDKKRLSSEGFGDTKPIETNDTEEGRAANRRVEFHISMEPVAETKKPKPAAKPHEGKPTKGAHHIK